MRDRDATREEFSYGLELMLLRHLGIPLVMKRFVSCHTARVIFPHQP
jgi:hypothetical protein